MDNRSCIDIARYPDLEPETISGLLTTKIGAIAALFNPSPFAIANRATSDSPTGGYAPGEVPCPPDRPMIREGGSLSANESRWLNLRRQITIDPMRELLGRLGIPNFDAEQYIAGIADNTTALPNYAIAFSGGGYRALMNGAGALAAFDSRTVNSTRRGHLGGLLQGATYVAGLSGGCWLVGSIFVNNFTTVQALQAAGSGSVWQFDNSILKGPDKSGRQIANTADYYDNLFDSVTAKSDAAFNTTLTDYWGRALSYQLILGEDGGPGITLSSIALDPQFINGSMPMPLIVACSRAPGELLISSNTTVFDFSPFELGTSDPTVYGFAPLRYLGTRFSNGTVPKDAKCIRGFDNAGFVMGTSSSLFNTFLLYLNGTDIPKKLKDSIRDILTTLSVESEDIADYTPNPFFQWSAASDPIASADTLTLVDGGEALENIPLHPLIQPERALDAIFAVDSSADTSNWPNGTALVATYERSLGKIQNGTAFPPIPDTNTFVNLGLNQRPHFFGCDRANLTGPAPIIVYIPNAPYSFLSNISTFQLSTSNADRDSIIKNGYNAATLGNGTVYDTNWPVCVGCAILSRSLDRTGTPIPDTCKQCFQRYCWNSTLDSRTPSPYLPKYALKSGSTNSAPRPLTWNFVAAIITAAVIAFALI